MFKKNIIKLIQFPSLGLLISRSEECTEQCIAMSFKIALGKDAGRFSRVFITLGEYLKNYI